jgi:hypothetical protein
MVHLWIHLTKRKIINNENTSFIPPEGGGAAEAFQSLFSHTDGKIRDGYGEDGCGRKVVGSERLILTQHSPYLKYETYHDVMVWGNF